MVRRWYSGLGQVAVRLLGKATLCDSLAGSCAQETRTDWRMTGRKGVLTLWTRVFAVDAAAALAVADAVLVRSNLVVRVKKKKAKEEQDAGEKVVFYPPPGGMDECAGHPIVSRNRMESVGQPAKKIVCVSSQLCRPVTQANSKERTLGRKVRYRLTDTLLQTLKRMWAGAAVIATTHVGNIG